MGNDAVLVALAEHSGAVQILLTVRGQVFDKTGPGCPAAIVVPAALDFVALFIVRLVAPGQLDAALRQGCGQVDRGCRCAFDHDADDV